MTTEYMTEDEYYMMLGKSCKELREKQNISPSEMIKQTGMSRSLLYEFETKGKKISAWRLSKIFRVLGLSTIEDLLSVKKNPSALSLMAMA